MLDLLKRPALGLRHTEEDPYPADDAEQANNPKVSELPAASTIDRKHWLTTKAESQLKAVQMDTPGRGSAPGRSR